MGNRIEYDWQADIEENRAPIKPNLDALKASWRKDPDWDIEETPGYEEHRTELLAYRLQAEQEWKDEHEEYRRRFPERYRGMFFEDPRDIAKWANEQAAEGYRTVSVMPCSIPTIEGGSWAGVYLLMNRTGCRVVDE